MYLDENFGLALEGSISASASYPCISVRTYISLSFE
jgi:hypothetical protein|tara:strand:+ start:123 stop:230 length:108 start_codon:yes stop_codon:yes gene_type:complete